MFAIIDSFPDPSYHGQWQVSKRMKLFLWEPLTHRGWVGGQGDREGQDEGCWESEGNTVNVRLGGEKATICIQLERGAWSAESEGEIQTQTSAEQSWPDRCVCVISGRMDLTQRWCWQWSFAGPSQTATAGQLRPVVIQSHIQRNATSNLT